MCMFTSPLIFSILRQEFMKMVGQLQEVENLPTRSEFIDDEDEVIQNGGDVWFMESSAETPKKFEVNRTPTEKKSSSTSVRVEDLQKKKARGNSGEERPMDLEEEVSVHSFVSAVST